MISFSSIERAFACPVSTKLPQHPHTGAPAIQGTKNHTRTEDSIHDGTAPPQILSLLEGCLEYHTEVSYAIDVDNGNARRIGEGLSRDYGPLSESEIPGTLDLEVVFNDYVLVVDWKSRQRVTEASDNWQIACQAYSVYKHYGKPVRAGLMYLDNLEQDFADFGAIKLSGVMRRLYEGMNDVYTALATDTPQSGPWCGYCNALLSCPTTKAALALLANGEDVPYYTLKKLKNALELAEEKLKLTLGPTKPGYRLKLVDQQRTYLDKTKVMDMLKAAGENADGYMRTTAFSVLKEVKDV